MSFDEQTREDLKRLARIAGVYLGVFLAGGIFTFAYSYRPLHGAKNWKIGYLEEQLETSRSQLDQLDQELSQSRTAHLNQPNAEAFKAVQTQLAETDASIADLEKQLKKSKKKIKELERSRDSWKKKYSAAEKDRDELAARVEANEAAAAEESPMTAEPASPESDSAPASVDPAAATEPDSADHGSIIQQGITIGLGKSWTSEDGRARFDVTAVEPDLAQVVTEPPAADPGADPDVISVKPGDRFQVGANSGAPFEIVVTNIDGTHSITVDVRMLSSEPS